MTKKQMRCHNETGYQLIKATAEVERIDTSTLSKKAEYLLSEFGHGLHTMACDRYNRLTSPKVPSYFLSLYKTNVFWRFYESQKDMPEGLVARAKIHLGDSEANVKKNIAMAEDYISQNVSYEFTLEGEAGIELSDTTFKNDPSKFMSKLAKEEK